MGWTETHKEPKLSLKDSFKREFVLDSDKQKGEVIDCKSVGWNSAYIAYKITEKKDNVSKVVAIVVLIQRKNTDYYNFGYKAMYENEGPFYWDCPKSILELLTKPNNINTLEWRKKCAFKVKSIIKNKDLLNEDLIP